MNRAIEGDAAMPRKLAPIMDGATDRALRESAKYHAPDAVRRRRPPRI